METSEFERRVGDPVPGVRLAALAELADLAKRKEAGAEFVPALLGLLGEPAGEVRSAAATALGWIAFRAQTADPALLEPATRLLDDPVAMIRHDGAWILESLAQRGVADGKAIPALIRNLGHDNGDTRAASAFCLYELAKIGHADPAALTALEKLAATATDQTESRAATSPPADLKRRLGKVPR
ncbi:MAG: HEAT repeat domain-containing protein [Candidatus Sericytochromatia bacterium]|nr:HEAT repeat domain-containing protein [Candidatus Tanganyikabacteria bacterium]